MAIWKDINNLYDDMDGAALHLLPAGCVEITDAEVSTIRAASITQPTPAQLVQEQITQLEQQSMIPRVIREFTLAQAVITAQAAGVTESQLYVVNIGYKKLKDLDAQIVALRAQLI